MAEKKGLPDSCYFGLSTWQRPDQGCSPFPYLSLSELAAFVRQPVGDLVTRLYGSEAISTPTVRE